MEFTYNLTYRPMWKVKTLPPSSEGRLALKKAGKKLDTC